MFASLFILLYAAHLAADYPLQTDHQAAHKADRCVAGWRANLAHAGTHAAATALALAVAVTVLGHTIKALPALLALAWITGTHAFIDRRWPVARWMRFARQEQWAQRGGAAHVDQTAHVLVLLVAALALTR
ncbi:MULTISPECIES: DUF3307 domain-containing protein [Streptomyces]|uniref:DUF3307 domain-containing protein n=1 Tax=Streptomyces TaxID=1883 RepID=UPI00081B1501|nr:DUF3307 domain-containing protein [Streptomyces sp. OspMP-M43]SCE40402.1 Protein of unknown function [Streptomyces sp. OspMP-M43]